MMSIKRFVKSFLMLLCFAVTSVARAQTPAPELMSSEKPAAIPADHKAVIESEQIVEKINKDSFFHSQMMVKLSKNEEQIAISRRLAAEANAEACKADRSFCNGSNIASQEMSQTEIDAQRKKDAEAASEKAIADSIRAASNEEKAKLNSVVLKGLTNEEAFLNISGLDVTLRKGASYQGIKVGSINASSVFIVGTKYGNSREVSVNESLNRNSSNIKPIFKAENKADNTEN